PNRLSGMNSTSISENAGAWFGQFAQAQSAHGNVVRCGASQLEFYRPGEIADMKTPALLLLGFVLCAASAFSQTESEIRDRIVGTWKLVYAVDIMKDGTTRPYPAYGPHGNGFLMYQRDGYMCADLVNPDRPKWTDPLHTTSEEKVAAAD